MEEDTITISSAMSSDSEYTFDIADLTVNTIDISDITYSTTNTGTITLEDTHWTDSITWEQVEFEDHMPSVAKVEDMCKDYPALAQAYENFKTIYTLVHQDWKGKNDKDEELPF
jgi:hypothetical protein